MEGQMTDIAGRLVRKAVPIVILMAVAKGAARARERACRINGASIVFTHDVAWNHMILRIMRNEAPIVFDEYETDDNDSVVIRKHEEGS